MRITFKHEKGTPRGARSASIKFGKQATGFIEVQVGVSRPKAKGGLWDDSITIGSLTMAYDPESYAQRSDAEDAALSLAAKKLFALSSTAEQMAVELQARSLRRSLG